MSYLSKFIEFKCLLNATTDTQNLDTGVFARTLIFTCFSPLIFIAIFSCLYAVISLFKVDKVAIKNQWFCMVVIILWLFQPEICHLVFQSFSCLDIENTGTSRLFMDLEVVCWEG